MGFGCNAAGVIGCRIIDSQRERLIGILTNAFVPCNGRFPTLITLLTMFFLGEASHAAGGTALCALLLTVLIMVSILLTLFVSYLLSRTVLKGVPSSFALELPPYRRPQFGKILVRSLVDRTLFVLGRAAAVAAPAGALLWLLANITVGDASLLTHITSFFDPFAGIFGLDGAILVAFLLGMPANEIVVPILLMAYTATGSLVEYESLFALKSLLCANGWTLTTALCTLVFTLVHWPCATTTWTIYRETKSLKYTLLGFCLPTACGFLLCFLIASGSRLLGFI